MLQFLIFIWFKFFLFVTGFKSCVALCVLSAISFLHLISWQWYFGIYFFASSSFRINRHTMDSVVIFFLSHSGTSVHTRYPSKTCFFTLVVFYLNFFFWFSFFLLLFWYYIFVILTMLNRIESIYVLWVFVFLFSLWFW